MLSRLLTVVAAAGCLALAWPSASSAQPSGKPAATPPVDGAALLEKARAAVAKLDALSYDGVVTNSEGLQGPEGRAQVSMAKADAGGWKVYAKGVSGAAPFEVAYDGVLARSVREADKVVYEKTPKDHGDLVVFFSGQNAKHGVAWELIADSPLPGAAATLEGEADLAGEKCDVLKVAGRAGPGETAPDADHGYTLVLSRRDHLPRRIVRPVGVGGAQARVLTLENFRVNKDSLGAPYSLGVPDGYAVRQADAVRKKRSVGGGPREPANPGQAEGVVGVGAPAPDFSLRDVNGKAHTLSGYKGKVVVLDFWATWCGWCVKGMPAVQKVHQKFKGQDVVVLGIGYNETGDGAAFMRENKYTYGLLLGGEVLKDKYGINGIPAMFIIGKDGKVLWRADGYSPQHEKHMTEVIQKELGGK